MIRRNITKTLFIGLATMLTLMFLTSGWFVPEKPATEAEASSLKLLTTDAEAGLLTKAPIQASNGAEILLNPFSGPASSPVTVNGRGWQAGDTVTVFVVHDNINYAISSAKVDPQGNFQTSFFIPDAWQKETTLTVGASDSPAQDLAQAFYTITDLPTPTPTAAPAAPQAVVNANFVNVRRGPGVNYPRLGVIYFNNVLRINGQSSGWWRIDYPNAYGDFGWVSGEYVSVSNVENVPLVQAPPPPPPPTATPLPPQANLQCNPGEWSGCGGASCQAEYVSQCSSEGLWQACVWDPGHCSVRQDDHHAEDNHTHHHHNDYDDDDDDDDDGDDLDDHVPDLNWFPVPTKK